MKLPSHKEFRDGLRRWREEFRRERPVDVAKASRTHSARPFRPSQVAKWESGKLAFNYRRLVEDILPAYQIPDFDIFIDFCRTPRLADIKVVEVRHFGTDPIAEGIDTTTVGFAFLEQNRTRIDLVAFDADSKAGTRWEPHEGHEFVLVLLGEVTCEFSEAKTGSPVKKCTLKEGMAIAFNSALYHRFYNESGKAAKLAAAKPSWAGTAGGRHFID